MFILPYVLQSCIHRRQVYNVSMSYFKRFHTINYQNIRKKSFIHESIPSGLIKPIQIESNKYNLDKNNVGAELVGKIEKNSLLKCLNKFTQKKEIKNLCFDYGLDEYVQQQAFVSFRRYCMENEHLPVDLHIILSDILQNAGHIDDIFPYFISFAKTIFPHLECMDDLKKISDLRTPANWYPRARAKTRKIIFHSGPTNSGKTYHAMERFLSAKCGIYCGPLKLLATEVFHKANDRGVPCDLVTGEERKNSLENGISANHLACTVEMASVSTPYEVAVIDEIQLLKDPQRGWAWTRAFLGLIADEIHVCGESGSIDLLKKICESTNETVVTHVYDRLTDLTVENSALVSLENVMPGDCIVCFNKNDIYQVSRHIEALGKEVAVIYGGLPPGTKLAQAEKFNDPKNSCKILVATDAIGMGLNLSIRRVIFFSIMKPSINEKGEREIKKISVSQALQIAGRAGRYRTQWENGFVTTFKNDDLLILKEILNQKPEPLLKAGLHPTADQIELYAYHLPNSSLSNLMDIFVNLCTVDDSLYFMCNIDDFKFLAEMIQHVPLPLRARYLFCCAPINKKMPFVCSMFLKISRQYSKNQPITFEFISKHCGWPLFLPKTIMDLVYLESVFDVMDLYLWLRFSDLFPHTLAVRDAQKELDKIIQIGVFQITKLLKNSDESPNMLKSVMEGTNKDEQLSSYVKNVKGRLTERLVSQGLLTSTMLKELKREWLSESLKQDNVNILKRKKRKF